RGPECGLVEFMSGTSGTRRVLYEVRCALSWDDSNGLKTGRRKSMTTPWILHPTLMRSLLALATLGFLQFACGSVRADMTVRHGMQIGALGALRTALPAIEKKHGLTYDIKDFRDSTSALLALDQGELDIANTTSQHLVRAISEGIDVV